MNSVRSSLLRVVLPLGIAFLSATLLFALTGYDVIEVWGGVVTGSITGRGAFAQTLRWTVPLLIIGLGIIATLRTGEFNIGAQGQLALGGIGTVIVALTWADGPPLLVVPIALTAGILLGALWSALAGWLKISFGADEVITTLMLNFVSILLTQWLTTGPFRNDAVRGETASTPLVNEAYRLTSGIGISAVLILFTIIVTLIVWVILERTPYGLKSRLVGSNPIAAAWQGIDIRSVQMRTYLLAGALAGLAGGLEVLGPNGRLVTGATPTIGFTAIVVAIVGSLSVPGIVVAALFFGGLQAAILYLPIVSDLPSSGIRILEGTVALLITAHLIQRRLKAN
ncbi:MAG: ABC transporter permease [Chloroflexota bacterium]